MKHSATLSRLPNQKVLILGLGAEGWSTYEFLRRQFPELPLTLADRHNREDIPQEKLDLAAKDPHATLFLGEYYLEKCALYDIIFKAPGIPRTLPPLLEAVQAGAALSSNTQLFFELCPGKIIGVTGTKGKSTTASLIYQLLYSAGLDALLVGNIGVPALAFMEQITPETLVIFELSSHQLETLTVSPTVAVIQSITSEHLDYYATTEEYQAAKSSIARFQTADDSVIYNPKTSVAPQIAALSPGKHIQHTLEDQSESTAFIQDGTIMYRPTGQAAVPVLPAGELLLPGQHNLYNVLPSVIVAFMHGVKTEQITETLRTFKGLPHRLELVGTHNERKYYDDSLATNPFATIRALENFQEPVVLIAGGYERQQNFADLAALIAKRNVTGLVLFRPTGERLMEAVSQATGDAAPPMEFAESMEEAVEKSVSMLPVEGGVVLMSPASASFGRFKDYRDRGLQFQEAVKKYLE
jgi:UDP-N-acetylmuramoylalanine--D-glutamate ligase